MNASRAMAMLAVGLLAAGTAQAQGGADRAADVLNKTYDHGAANSTCGNADNSISSVCRPGMIQNKGKDPDSIVVDKAALAEVHRVAEERKALAQRLAERVRGGAEVPAALVAQVRDGLARDLDLWRAEYRVGDQEFAAARTRWVRDAASLTPAEWVLWRAAWFDERDRWVAARGGK